MGWLEATKSLLFAELLQSKQTVTTPNHGQRIEPMSAGGGSLWLPRDLSTACLSVGQACHGTKLADHQHAWETPGVT